VQGAEQLRPFVIRTGVISSADYLKLITRMETEVQREDFCGSALVLRVWGRVEPQEAGDTREARPHVAKATE